MSRREDFNVMPRRLFLQLVAGVGAVAVTGCASDDLPGAPEAAVDPASAGGGEDKKLYAFFSESFNREFERSPEWMTQLGVKKRYGEWNDWSDEFAEEDHRGAVADLEFMTTQIDRAALSDEMKISYDVFRFRNELRVANWPYRFHNYDISHFGGPHQNVASLLINQHRVDETADAEAYIARLKAVPKLFEQVTAFMRKAEARGITLPHFSYPLMIADAKRAVKGAPFEAGEDNPMLADFKTKVGKLSIGQAEKTRLIADASDALATSVKPASPRALCSRCLVLIAPSLS